MTKARRSDQTGRAFVTTADWETGRFANYNPIRGDSAMEASNGRDVKD